MARRTEQMTQMEGKTVKSMTRYVHYNEKDETTTWLTIEFMDGTKMEVGGVSFADYSVAIDIDIIQPK